MAEGLRWLAVGYMETVNQVSLGNCFLMAWNFAGVMYHNFLLLSVRAYLDVPEKVRSKALYC